jgi:DNA-binding protein WhiA
LSFTAQIKNEISALDALRDCCLTAELAALARVIGSIHLAPKPGTLVLSTESPAVARKIFKLAKHIGWLSAVTVRYYSRPRRYHLFIVQLPLQQAGQSLLRKLGLADRRGRLRDRLDQRILARGCCRRAFLRGCFLGSGFINRPGSDNHLEFVVGSSEAAEEIDGVLAQFGLTAGVRERKSGFGVYLKEAEQLAEVLRIIGANQGMLAFENNRIIRDMRNQVNRLVNCETSNMDKSVRTGLEQAEMIKDIAASVGLSSLQPNLRRIAELRLEHPEASLADLGRLLDPPLGKSGVNHRLRELRRIALAAGKHSGSGSKCEE